VNADDPRHGKYAGAVAHWMSNERPCDACSVAEARYRKTRKLKHLRGVPVTVSAVGIRRRLHALMALGYTGPQVAEASGLSIATMRSIDYHGSQKVHAITAEKVIAVYERLSMTRPEGQYANRARVMARRRGWLPPLAWDDIDDPTERPSIAGDRWGSSPDDVDPVVVARILSGDFTLRATRAEKEAVVAAWEGSHNELARRTGWKVERYVERVAEEVA
jgi:hypothetical protein